MPVVDSTVIVFYKSGWMQFGPGNQSVVTPAIRRAVQTGLNLGQDVPRGDCIVVFQPADMLLEVTFRIETLKRRGWWRVWIVGAWLRRKRQAILHEQLGPLVSNDRAYAIRVVEVDGVWTEGINKPVD